MTDITLQELVEKLRRFLRKEENQTYIYLSIFLLVFSFFLVFVIRPTVKSAFQARAKREELLKATQSLEKVVGKAVELQTQAEKFRDDIPLLFQAVPERVQISKIMREIADVLQQTNLKVVNASVSNINLVGEKVDEFNSVEIDYVLYGRFSDFLKVQKILYSQRRLKTIPSVLFVKEGGIETQATEEANVSITLKIEAYFL